MKKLFATLSILSVLFFFVPQAHAALTTNIVSYWKLDGNSNDAVSTNNGTDTNVTYSTANGIINQGAGFSGTGNINVGNSNSLTLGSAMSIALWTQPTTAPASYPMLLCKGSVNTSYEMFWNTAFSPARLAFRSKVSPDNAVTSTTSASVGTWYFVVATWDGTTSKIYVDGYLSNSNTVGGFDTNTGNLYLATCSSSNVYTGDVDEVGIWTRALSSAEVLQLYNSGAGLQYPFTIAAVSSLFARIYSWF